MKLFVKKEDTVVAGAAVALQILGSAALVSLLGTERALPVVGGLAVATILAVAFYTLRREQALSIYDRDAAQNYRQIESLFGLYSTIALSAPLPPMRHWAISPDALVALLRELLLSGAHQVVECGSGISTVVLAKFVGPRGGHVWSLENGPGYAERTRELLTLHGVAEHATVIHGELAPCEIAGSTVEWYDPDAVAKLPERIDLLFVDGPWHGPRDLRGALARYPAVSLLRSRFHRTLIALDDFNRPDEQETVRRWLEELPGYAVEEVPAEKGFAVLRPGDE